jgi:hypothetical protein
MSGPPPWHHHVTEREPDGTWEDCLPSSAVMHARAAHSRAIPATHTEAQSLRNDAGLPEAGGVTIHQILVGFRRRYGWDGGQLVPTAQFLDRLVPGTSAVVSGRLASFPAGHRLRRWQPGFTGGHAVWVARLADGTYWWDDPLAPAVGYAGEEISRDELAVYVRGWPGDQLVAPTLEESEMFPVVTREPFQAPAAWTLPAGAVLNGYDPTQPGKIVRSVTGPAQGHASARVSVRWVGVAAGQKPPVPTGAPFLEVAEGPLAGLLVVERFVTLGPGASGPSERARALAEAKAAAVAAVSQAIDALIKG